MTIPQVLNIVVVGAGLIGPRHASHVQKNPNCKLFGLVDPLIQSISVAKLLNTVHFSLIQQMIQHCQQRDLPLPDGAIVCTPNHTHIAVAAELAQHGIHLLVEKPLSSNPRDAAALKEFVQGKVQLLVGHHRRFNPYIVAAKKNLPALGEIIAIQGSWALKKPAKYFEESPWRTDCATGGGVLLINLVHDLDLLQYLFGPIERIYAELLKKQRKQYPNVDEGAALTIKFKNGIMGTFICSDNITSPFNFESGTGENPTVPLVGDLQGLYRIFGSKGTLSVPDLTLFHQPGDKGEESWLKPITKTALVEDRATLQASLPFDLQLDHFVQVIRGEADPCCTADDGITVLLCIDAVVRSIETGLPQMVEDIHNIKALDVLIPRRRESLLK